MKTYKQFIIEASMSDTDKQELWNLIQDFKVASGPESDDWEEADVIIAKIKKKFGDKIAKQVKNGEEKMHFGRPNRSAGYDKLSSRKKPRVTKSGKANKQDTNALKTDIKWNKKLGR